MARALLDVVAKLPRETRVRARNELSIVLGFERSVLVRSVCKDTGRFIFTYSQEDGSLCKCDVLIIGCRVAPLTVYSSDVGCFSFSRGLEGKQVFCGHEYTVSNLQFALAVEPDNPAVAEKLRWAQETLACGGYTVPSTVAEELAYNPFMRVEQPSVRRAVGAAAEDGRAVVMDSLRRSKNAFRPPAAKGMRLPGL